MSFNAPLDFEAFENAVHEWVESVLSIPTIWRRQNFTQPDYPFVTLEILSGPGLLSQSWVRTISQDLNLPQGTEIELADDVPARLTVSIHCYAENTADPLLNARAMASALAASLTMDSFSAALYASDVAVERAAPIKSFDAVVGTGFISHAVLDVVFTVVLSTVERTGYIKTVEAEGAITTETTTETINEIFGDTE